MREQLPELESIMPYLGNLEDARQLGKVKYPLQEILFLTLCAVLSDCLEWDEIVDFGEDKLPWLRKFYPYEHGIASHDTLNRAVSLIKPEAFSDVFRQWSTEKLLLDELHQICIDGKKLRSTATKTEQQTPREKGGKLSTHLLHAWCTNINLCIDVKPVDGKENEIVVIPKMIDDLEIEGCLISIDAMGCQRDIAQKIIKQGGEYLLSVKSNQKSLLNSVQSLFEADSQADSIIRYKTLDKDHGRVEERNYHQLIDLSSLDTELQEQWEGLKSIIRVERKRYTQSTGKEEKEVHYYITSAIKDVKDIAANIRNHWGIENKLHWHLDVNWGEDDNRKRVKNADINFALIVRVAKNLITNNDDKASVRRKKKKCHRSDEYREKILKIKI
jgi:predicted transposase YbfD/YdcC